MLHPNAEILHLTAGLQQPNAGSRHLNRQKWLSRMPKTSKNQSFAVSARGKAHRAGIFVVWQSQNVSSSVQERHRWNMPRRGLNFVGLWFYKDAAPDGAGNM
jgi:hypothetical protein